MSSPRLPLFFLLCLLVALPLGSQSTREIKKKEQELQRLREEIKAYEKKLAESERREKMTLDDLDDLDRQIQLIRKLVEKLRAEQQSLASDIEISRGSIASLEQRLAGMKSHYAEYVRSIYKHGKVYDIELLLGSRSLNQMYIRLEYLKRFSLQRRAELTKIHERKRELESQHRQLKQNLDRQQDLIAEKTGEETSLTKKATRRQNGLAALRKDRKQYRKELSRRTEAMKKVEELIADLIEKERLRKEREAKLAKEKAEREAREREARIARERERAGKTPKETPSVAAAHEPSKEDRIGSNFQQKRGRLRWPVSSGAIASRFGTQVHPVLKTVTQNTGIEISTPIGSNVFAVAKAEVAVISFIPGFGNIVILNHDNGYRTVYAHLSDIVVNESQTVDEGDVIAKSGDSVGGAILHFEIWKDRDKQNPETWLGKRK